MRTLAVMLAITYNPCRWSVGGAPLMTRFTGQTVVAHVAAALRQVPDIEQIVVLLPPDATAELQTECIALGLAVHDYGTAPYSTNLALRLADELGAEELLLVPAYALLLDPVLTGELLARHRLTHAALTNTSTPFGFAPTVVSVAALRQALRHKGISYDDTVPVFTHITSDPRNYPLETVKLPEVPAVTNLNYLHAVQETAFAALWSAAGGKGVLAATQFVTGHPELFDLFPHWAQVEVTSRCNQSCPVCPHTRRRDAVDLDDAAFDRIIDGLGWAGGNSGLDLAGFGEPLLHPGLRGFIDRAVAQTLEVYLYTNGTQWNRDWSSYVLDPARQQPVGGLKGIVFTINATTPDAYRAFHGTDDFDRVKRAVKELLLMKRERGARTPVIAVQIVKSQATDAQVEAFWQEWNYAEKFERQHLSDYDYAAEQGQLRLQTMVLEREDISAAQREAKLGAAHAAHHKRYWDAFYRHAELPLEHVVIQRCNDYAGQLPDTRVVDYTPLQRFACRQATYGLMVLANGTVTPCQQDFNGAMAVGNLHERDLLALWNDPKFSALRRDQCAGRYDTLPLCAACRDWFIPMI